MIVVAAELHVDPAAPATPSGNAWSTAFCISSLSTTASGVATSPGSSPASPSTMKRIRMLGRRRRVLDEPRQRPHDLVEAHDVAGVARQRLVHDRDRADPPLRLRERGPGLG